MSDFVYKNQCSNEMKLPRGGKKVGPNNIPGYKYGINSLYPNIALLAPKASGKTVAENNLLLEFIGPDTHVHIFSPTFQFDNSWNIAKDYFKENNVIFDSYPSLYLGDSCILRELMDDIDEKMKAKMKKKKKPPVEKQTVDDIKQREAEIIKKLNPINKKSKYKTILIPIAMPIKTIPIEEDDEEEDIEEPIDENAVYYPSDIIVIDDLSDELRKDRNVESLYKRNRHSKVVTIVSSQSTNDLTPKALANLDYVLLWGGLPSRSIKDMHIKIKQSIPLETFEQIYNDATSQKYDFLFIDIWNKKYQKNLG